MKAQMAHDSQQGDVRFKHSGTNHSCRIVLRRATGTQRLDTCERRYNPVQG